jgi:hypothetical protein
MISNRTFVSWHVPYAVRQGWTSLAVHTREPEGLWCLQPMMIRGLTTLPPWFDPRARNHLSDSGHPPGRDSGRVFSIISFAASHGMRFKFKFKVTKAP